MGDIAIKISDVHLAFGKNRVLRGVSGQKWMWKVDALKNSDR